MKSTLTIFSFFSVATTAVFAATVPDELEFTKFAGTDIVPSPACLCAAPTGEVFVGVDMNGSLGKGPRKGKIIRLVDSDNDGKADSHTVFAEIDNPRGLISVGKKLFVLHTVIPADTGILSGMHLSVLLDEDGDGKADGAPKRLVSDISVPKHNQDRGADHTTNGIAMGIDGWIYIAVGDFGFVGAKGTDGTELTMLGGGVVRVRPDGTELEVYTHGTRNIYDVAIDPFMNVFTRGNTNDGGGWNVRFIHHVQSGEYGYPVLFKNFTGEILPALQDIGGGSGTGALFFAEPNWPEKYTNVPMMADWGRSQLAIHRLAPDGASFTQVPEDFIKSAQISDVDVDGSGRLYLSAWDGAGYKGSDKKGYVERIVPKGWKYEAFPDLESLSDENLIKGLRKNSAIIRLHVSQELIRRTKAVAPILKVAADVSASLETRVAAIFTAKQLGASNEELAALSVDESIREWVVRSIADRRTKLAGAKVGFFEKGLLDGNPRVQVAAAIALSRLGVASAAEALFTLANPPEGTYQPEAEAATVAPPAFMSKKLKPHQPAAKINVDVKGWKELHLVVTEGGDGNGHDHAGWFDPTLVMADGSEKKLTDLKWKSAKGGWGKTLVGKDCVSKPLTRADEKKSSFGIGTHSPSHIVYDLPSGAVKFKGFGGATPGAHDGRGHMEYVVDSKPPVFAQKAEGPHATPNSPIILPHVSITAIRAVGANDTVLSALDGPNRQAALWALKTMHEPTVVDSLLSKLDGEKDASRRTELIALLARLYQKEAPYDGSWWWGTRPDTRGPFYVLEKWEKSDAIADVLKKEHANGDAATKSRLGFWNAKLRLDIEEIASEPSAGDLKEMDEPKVDLTKIAGGAAGEVGKTSIEDVILSLDDLKGDIKRGEKLFTQQGCIACHTITKDQPLKGPYMGQVGAILTRDQIAESILKPNASISQGFATVMVSKKDGGAMSGFVSAETADEVEMRDISGNVHEIKTANIKDRQELEMSMMPPGLANTLSLQDFASLVDFLKSKKE